MPYGHGKSEDDVKDDPNIKDTMKDTIAQTAEDSSRRYITRFADQFIPTKQNMQGEFGFAYLLENQLYRVDYFLDTDCLEISLPDLK